MRPLVIIYSMTGNTRLVGQLLATELDAPMVEISCRRYEGGFLGHLLQAWDIFRGGRPTIGMPSDLYLDSFDLLIVGGPVWAGRPAPPLRSLVERAKHHGRLVVFLTCSGTSKRFPGEKALDEISADASPLSKELFKDVEIAADEVHTQVEAFAERILHVWRIEHTAQAAGSATQTPQVGI